MNDLDFNLDSDYINATDNKSGYTEGEGFTPIGGAHSGFTVTFNGNIRSSEIYT